MLTVLYFLGRQYVCVHWLFLLVNYALCFFIGWYACVKNQHSRIQWLSGLMQCLVDQYCVAVSRCHEYFASTQRPVRVFGTFEVHLRSEEQCEHYVMRTLELVTTDGSLVSDSSQSASRSVLHFQFVSWPDFGNLIITLFTLSWWALVLIWFACEGEGSITVNDEQWRGISYCFFSICGCYSISIRCFSRSVGRLVSS